MGEEEDLPHPGVGPHEILPSSRMLRNLRSLNLDLALIQCVCQGKRIEAV